MTHLRFRLAAAATSLLLAATPLATTYPPSNTSACPDGTLRFGVEPYEDAAVLAPAYQPLADALGKSLGCQVELNITTNYTPEIEAMRNDKLDIAEDVNDLGAHSFAYSYPASTSGHLYPAFGLSASGIDPDTGVQPIYAGSHTSSFEAIRNHTVEAGELNSDQIAAATAAICQHP
jgi:phosphonate transport system substrate-binding protein